MVDLELLEPMTSVGPYATETEDVVARGWHRAGY